LGSYHEKEANKDLKKGQFRINDDRPLNQIIDELLDQNMLPSFCTSCYRAGRTGEHFMEFSVPGFIKRFCTPNAMITLAEYLEDYAPEHTAQKGWKVIEDNMAEVDDRMKEKLRERLEQVKKGVRDLYF
jgi:2-iminoacetate synthase